MMYITLLIYFSAHWYTIACSVLKVELVAFGSKFLIPNTAQLVYLGPAVSTAVDDVNAKYNGALSFTLVYVYDSVQYISNSNNEYTAKQIAEWYYRQRTANAVSILLLPNGLIFPDLSYLIGQWDFLYISLVSGTQTGLNRTLYPSWISTGRFNMPSVSRLFLSTFDTFNWTTFVIVNDVNSTGFYQTVRQQLTKDAVKRYGTGPLELDVIPLQAGYDFTPVLETIRNVARVVVYLGNAKYLRKFLITASSLNMTEGDYVFFAIDVLNNELVYGKMHWNYSDKYDTVARRAFQSLLVYRPTDYYDTNNETFAMKIIEKTKREFNFSYNIGDQPYQMMVNAYGVTMAVAEILADLQKANTTQDFSGSFLASCLLNRRFENSVGPIFIDKHGERQMDSFFWRFDANGTQLKFLYKPAGDGAPIQLHDLDHWAGSSWPPPNEPVCGYNNQKAVCHPGDNTYIGQIVGATVAVVMVIVFGFGLYACKTRNDLRKLEQTWWKIDGSELTLCPSNLERRNTIITMKTASLRKNSYTNQPKLHYLSAKLNDIPVTMEIIALSTQDPHIVNFSLIERSRSLVSSLAKLRSINHDNLVRLVGLTIVHNENTARIGVVFETVERGCLYDLFSSLITWDISLSSSLLSDFLDIAGVINIRLQTAFRTASPDIVVAHRKPDLPDSLSVTAVQKSDIYATGVFMYEIFSKQSVADKESVGVLTMPSDSPSRDYEPIIRRCLRPEPEERPAVGIVRTMLTEVSSSFSARKGIKLVDRIQNRLLDYASDLEVEVIARTKSLIEEMEQCDRIIAQFLPRGIVRRIRAGEHDLAELYDSVTMMFIQLCGFPALVNSRSPEKLISIVDEAEVILDRITVSYSDDAYKVEAVDDSYLMVSGLPVRNGNRHTSVILDFSRRTLKSLGDYFAPYSIEPKMGIHSGPCAAGVVGLRRLRYCMFGDTVNTASRMCSFGSPGRIHVSPFSARMVAGNLDFHLESRGTLLVKGKGEMETFWLLAPDSALDAANQTDIKP